MVLVARAQLLQPTSEGSFLPSTVSSLPGMGDCKGNHVSAQHPPLPAGL